MPPVFPSGQFPPGACGQVRPVGATLPTAARRAPLVKPRTAVPQGNTSLQDRRVLPKGQAEATPAWTGGVDNRITRTLSNIHLQQEQAAATPAWTGGVDRCRILTLMERATLARSSNRRKPECPVRHFLAHLQTRKRVSGRFLV